MARLSSGDVEISFEDEGDGRPVVLVHGWPGSSESWSAQVPALLGAGYRVVRYDRRGFGRSGKPGGDSAYDYDVLTGDLDALLRELDLSDVTLVGFSMGGGEVARYVGTYGQDRLHSVVFAAAITPCLLKDEQHPDGGLDRETAAGMADGLRADRERFLDEFIRTFFSSAGKLKITEKQRQDAMALARQAELFAAAQCIESWLEDFSGDLASLTLPTLVIHGDSDAIVPVEVSGQRTHDAVAGSKLVVVADGPHGVNVSHADQFNAALLSFLQR